MQTTRNWPITSTDACSVTNLFQKEQQFSHKWSIFACRQTGNEAEMSLSKSCRFPDSLLLLPIPFYRFLLLLLTFFLYRVLNRKRKCSVQRWTSTVCTWGTFVQCHLFKAEPTSFAIAIWYSAAISQAMFVLPMECLLGLKRAPFCTVAEYECAHTHLNQIPVYLSAGQINLFCGFCQRKWTQQLNENPVWSPAFLNRECRMRLSTHAAARIIE